MDQGWERGLSFLYFIYIYTYIFFLSEKKDSGVMDGKDDLYFTSFSTVFQSCLDDGQMKMKGCVHYGWDDFASSGAQTRDL